MLWITIISIILLNILSIAGSFYVVYKLKKYGIIESSNKVSIKRKHKIKVLNKKMPVSFDKERLRAIEENKKIIKTFKK